MPPITPIYGFGPNRWKGYECLSGGHGLGMVYQQYVPPAMEPGVVVEMAKLIPQPQPVFVRGQGPFNGSSSFGIVRSHPIGPFYEPPIVRRMAQDLDTPMMAGADDDARKTTVKDAVLGIAISSIALVVGVSAVFWLAKEATR